MHRHQKFRRDGCIMWYMPYLSVKVQDLLNLNFVSRPATFSYQNKSHIRRGQQYKQKPLPAYYVSASHRGRSCRVVGRSRVRLELSGERTPRGTGPQRAALRFVRANVVVHLCELRSSRIGGRRVAVRLVAIPRQIWSTLTTAAQRHQ
eukprot:6183403-Pleurochrysis_carterae.AAC.1